MRVLFNMITLMYLAYAILVVVLGIIFYANIIIGNGLGVFVTFICFLAATTIVFLVSIQEME